MRPRLTMCRPSTRLLTPAPPHTHPMAPQLCAPLAQAQGGDAAADGLLDWAKGAARGAGCEAGLLAAGALFHSFAARAGRAAGAMRHAFCADSELRPGCQPCGLRT